MQLFPSRMVADVQDELLDTLGRRATAQTIGVELNRALRNLLATIRRNNQDFFKASATVNVVAGTSEYDLPLDCPPDGVTAVEPYSADLAVSKRYIPWNDQAIYAEDGNTFYYTMAHDGRRGRLRIVPEPSVAETVTVRYTRAHAEMQYGTPTAIAATALTLPAIPTMGRVELETAPIIGARVMLTAGSGAGQVRTVSGYNTTTRSATVDAAFSPVPASAATTTYEILPGWVDDHAADVVELDALIRLDKRDRGDGARWMDTYAQKLATVLSMTKTLQRSQAHVIRLGRGFVRPTRRHLNPGQIF